MRALILYWWRRLHRPIALHLRRSFSFRFPVLYFRVRDAASRANLDAIQGHPRRLNDHWNDVESIFIHVPKTAGTAIGNNLQRLCGDRYAVVGSHKDILRWLEEGRTPPNSVRLNHVSPEILLRSGMFEKHNLADGRVFTVVRDPFARFFSSFHYARRRGHIAPKTTEFQLLRKLEVFAARREPKASKSVGIAFFRPQVEFFCGLDPSEISIFRFDEVVAGRTALPFMVGNPVNATPYPQSPRVLSDREREVFETIYHADLALWRHLKS
jgi:hypothetical protein